MAILKTTEKYVLEWIGQHPQGFGQWYTISNKNGVIHTGCKTYIYIKWAYLTNTKYEPVLSRVQKVEKKDGTH